MVQRARYRWEHPKPDHASILQVSPSTNYSGTAQTTRYRGANPRSLVSCTIRLIVRAVFALLALCIVRLCLRPAQLRRPRPNLEIAAAPITLATEGARSAPITLHKKSPPSTEKGLRGWVVDNFEFMSCSRTRGMRTRACTRDLRDLGRTFWNTTFVMTKGLAQQMLLCVARAQTEPSLRHLNAVTMKS